MLKRYIINITLILMFTGYITYMLNPYIDTKIIWVYIIVSIVLYCISTFLYIYSLKYKIKLLTRKIQNSIISSLDDDLKDFYLEKDILDSECEKVSLTAKFNYYDLNKSILYLDSSLTHLDDIIKVIKEVYTIAIINNIINQKVYEVDYYDGIKQIIKNCSKIKDKQIRKIAIVYLKNLLKLN